MDMRVEGDTPKERGRGELDEEGIQLRKEIFDSVHSLPKRTRFDHGRRHDDHRCVADVLVLIERLYADNDPREDLSPAVNHVIRATHTVAVRYKTGDPTLIMAMDLHDAVEDHAEKLARLLPHIGLKRSGNNRIDAIRFVKRRFGHTVGNLVEKVTHTKSSENKTPQAKIAEYKSYVIAVARNPSTLILKIADVRDNIFNPRPTKNGGFYSMKKYESVLGILEKGIERHKVEIVRRWGKPTYDALQEDLKEMKSRAQIFNASAPVEA